MKKTLLLIFIGFFIFSGATFVYAGGTLAEAKALAEKAAGFLKAHGKEKTLAEISKPGGQFDKGEMYVYAFDMTGTVLAHPKNPGLIGKNTYNIPDEDGKFFRKDIVELAKTKGSGWVDYKYLNPETKKVEDKTTYVLRVGDIIVCCGVYVNKH
ncbi:MAG: cache type 2 domain-containing protein [Deltaproteobacteria bacterium RBG_13_52_11]|nr:MAG: cache type 2 domain-containing protein [Deltaproteobacteria bacterium RBG_13_52_11]